MNMMCPQFIFIHFHIVRFGSLESLTTRHVGGCGRKNGRRVAVEAAPRKAW